MQSLYSENMCRLIIANVNSIVSENWLLYKPISVLLDVMKTSKSLDNDENIPMMKETVDDTMR